MPLFVWGKCLLRFVRKFNLDHPATPQQVQEMLEAYPILIKIVVDIRRRLLAGGGEMHAESLPRFSGHCEAVLLVAGSEQDDLWGANWYPDEQRIEPALSTRRIRVVDQHPSPAGQSQYHHPERRPPASGRRHHS